MGRRLFNVTGRSLADAYLAPDGRRFDWEAETRRWCGRRRGITPALTESIVSFFRMAFENTQFPHRAWFGTRRSSVSLLVGHIYLASIVGSGHDRGVWLLVDQGPPPVAGVGYRPVKSTRGSSQPLVWAHAESLDVIPRLVSHAPIWDSFRSASSKIFAASPASADRDAVNERHGKRRLSEFWHTDAPGALPEELRPDDVYVEGAKRMIVVNAYERDEKARARCIARFGRRCAVCDFSFGEAYGTIAEHVIHVHHLRPLSQIGEEYVVDPIADLRPVCPNCHAVLHLRKPVPYCIDELKALLGGRVLRAIVPNRGSD